jgi:hypothetical protein
MDLARAPRRAPLTARKKGSGYENDPGLATSAKALGTRLHTRKTGMTKRRVITGELIKSES